MVKIIQYGIIFQYFSVVWLVGNFRNNFMYDIIFNNKIYHKKI